MPQQFTCRVCVLEIDPRGPAVSNLIRVSRSGAPHRAAPVYIPFLEEWSFPERPQRELSHPRCFVDVDGIDEFLQAVIRHDREARPERIPLPGGEPTLVDVTKKERRLLMQGLREWGGPAYPTREMAVAMGFADVADLFEGGDRIAALLESERPLAPFDWTRALLSAEIVFASDVLGSGIDWATTTGDQDHETIATLRNLQRKLYAARVVVRPGYRTK